MNAVEKALWYAISDKCLPLVQQLLPLFLEKKPEKIFKTPEEYPDLCFANEQAGNRGFLFHALESGTDDIVREIYKVLPIKAKLMTTASGETPLWLAAKLGKTELCRDLLALGSPVDAANVHGETPLIVAAQNGHVATVDVLLVADPRVNQPDKKGNTALHYACWKENFDTVSRLLQAKALPHYKNNSNQTPLAIAIEKDNEKLIFLLFTYGAAIAATLPKLSQKVLDYLVKQLVDYKYPILMLGTQFAAADTPKVVAMCQQFPESFITDIRNLNKDKDDKSGPNKNRITFETPAREYAVALHCRDLVTASKNYGYLKPLCSLNAIFPTLVSLVRLQLQKLTTEKKVRELLDAMKAKGRPLPTIGLPPALLKTDKIIAFNELLCTVILARQTSVVAENAPQEATAAAILPIVPIVPIRVEDTELACLRQNELTHITNILEQLRQLDQALEDFANSLIEKIKCILSFGFLPYGYKAGLPLTLLLIAAIFGQVLSDTYSALWFVSMLTVVFDSATLGTAFMIGSIIVFANRYPLKATLSDSCDQLFEYLEQIQDTKETRDTELDTMITGMQEKRNPTGSCTEFSKTLNGVDYFYMKERIPKLQAFFNREQQLINSPEGETRLRYRYYDEVRFYPPVKKPEPVATTNIAAITDEYVPVMEV